MKLICLGNTFEMSNAAETKFATTLMPSVATAKVSAASRPSTQLSNLAEICSGCSSTSPYTLKAAIVVTPATSEKAIRLTGRPRRLPFVTAALFLAYREKSQKLRYSAAK
ncbi:hypothetical protein D3C81_1908090 [compost metagenome]